MLAGPLFLPAGFAGFGAVAGPAALPVGGARNEWLFAAQARVFGCGSHGDLQCLGLGGGRNGFTKARGAPVARLIRRDVAEHRGAALAVHAVAAGLALGQVHLISVVCRPWIRRSLLGHDLLHVVDPTNSDALIRSAGCRWARRGMHSGGVGRSVLGCARSFCWSTMRSCPNRWRSSRWRYLMVFVRMSLKKRCFI